MDGDLVPDYALGVPQAGGGAIHLLSGVDGSELSVLRNFTLAPHFGTEFEPLQDITGDSVRELAIAVGSVGAMPR